MSSHRRLRNTLDLCVLRTTYCELYGTYLPSAIHDSYGVHYVSTNTLLLWTALCILQIRYFFLFWFASMHTIFMQNKLRIRRIRLSVYLRYTSTNTILVRISLRIPRLRYSLFILRTLSHTYVSPIEGFIKISNNPLTYLVVASTLFIFIKKKKLFFGLQNCYSLLFRINLSFWFSIFGY